jgi:UvrB/uvrC motif
MIRIFNNKIQKEILIDDATDCVIVSPRDYEIENPHILIDLVGIDFLNHAQACSDCKAFIDNFGTRNLDWYLEYKGKSNRLDLFEVGNSYYDNQAKTIISDDFSGTKLKLKFDTDTIETLQEELSENVSNENYERCVFLRDKINSIRNI